MPYVAVSCDDTGPIDALFISDISAWMSQNFLQQKLVESLDGSAWRACLLPLATIEILGLTQKLERKKEREKEKRKQ